MQREPTAIEPPPTDGQLFEAYRQGSALSFEKLLRRYEKPLFTFILRMAGNKDDAEDIYQDTLVRIIKNISLYDERGKFSSWLFGIAHRLCVDRSRKKQRWKFDFNRRDSVEESALDMDFVDSGPLPDILLEKQELHEAIMKALTRLPFEQREIFLLRQHTDITFREIAATVNRPLNTVLSQMRSAVLSIRSFLQENMK